MKEWLCKRVIASVLSVGSRLSRSSPLATLTYRAIRIVVSVSTKRRESYT